MGSEYCCSSATDNSYSFGSVDHWLAVRGGYRLEVWLWVGRDR